MSQLSECVDFGLHIDRDGFFGGCIRAYYETGRGWFAVYYGAVPGYAHGLKGSDAWPTPEAAVRRLWKGVHG